MEKVALLLSLELSSLNAGEYLKKLSAIFKPPAFSTASKVGVILSNLVDIFSPLMLLFHFTFEREINPGFINKTPTKNLYFFSRAPYPLQYVLNLSLDILLPSIQKRTLLII